jgi:intracellular sulfur oxidation DsrE/DsrF family protein
VKVLFHAPTAPALARARAAAADLHRQLHAGTVRIVASDDAVVAAVRAPDPDTDSLLILCRRALEAHGVNPPAGIELAPDAGYLLARLQAKGWSYVRA